MNPPAGAAAAVWAAGIASPFGLGVPVEAFHTSRIGGAHLEKTAQWAMTLEEYDFELTKLAKQTEALRKIALRYAKPADVDDIIQHVLLNLSRLQPQVVAGIQSLPHYVDRAICNRAIDVAIQRSRGPQCLDINAPGMDADIHRTVDEFSASPKDPLDILEYEELRELLLAAVNLLDAQEHAVIATMLDGHSLRKTADLLGISLDRVRGLSGRSLKKLRQIIETWSRTSHSRRTPR
jgi:RNA polymerase sigma factor (sigma-70 family)